MKQINNDLFSEIKEVLNEVPIDFGGGCSLEKASLIAWLITKSRGQHSVDIGVYRGRSLYPQALAFKNLGGGTAFGVDPYSSTEAFEKDDPKLSNRPNLKKEIDTFIENTDFNLLHDNVQENIRKFGLSDYCNLIRKTSSQASKYFIENKITFGLVHIDGNHDTDRVKEDLSNYLPLVAESGYIVMDDISWAPIKKVLESIDKRYSLIYKLVDDKNDFAIYYKSNNALDLHRLKRELRKLMSSYQ